jgi:hypothetical protein
MGGLVGHYREIGDEDPGAVHQVGRFRDATTSGSPGQRTRLIYLDEVRVHAFLVQVATTGQGRNLLGQDSAMDGVLPEHNPGVLVSRLVQAVDVDGPQDLADETAHADISDAWHPGQAVGLIGRVESATTVLPASFTLTTMNDVARILVDRDRALHLNQAYLTRWRLVVVGRVQSVPRRQVRAIGVGVFDLWVPRTHPPSSGGELVFVDEPAQPIGSS